MGNIILGILAVLSFYIGWVYLFKHDLAEKWDSNRRRALGQSNLVRNAAWEVRATRRGISAIIVGILLIAMMTGVI